MSDEATLKAIEAERGIYYGDPRFNHENIGIVWGGLLRAAELSDGRPVPPDVVVLMMACGVKGVRACNRTPYNPDDYLDTHVYVDFADRFRKEDYHGQVNSPVHDKPPAKGNGHATDIQKEMEGLKQEAIFVHCKCD